MHLKQESLPTPCGDGRRGRLYEPGDEPGPEEHEENTPENEDLARLATNPVSESLEEANALSEILRPVERVSTPTSASLLPEAPTKPPRNNAAHGRDKKEIYLTQLDRFNLSEDEVPSSRSWWTAPNDYGFLDEDFDIPGLAAGYGIGPQARGRAARHCAALDPAGISAAPWPKCLLAQFER
jgi:DNA-directed RNA polymerase specialized sigma54-like protein